MEVNNVAPAIDSDKLEFVGQCKDGRMAMWGENSDAYVVRDSEETDYGGILYYTILNSRTIIINQVYVKRKFRGRGMAKDMYKELFNDFTDHTIIVTVPKDHVKWLVEKCYFKIYSIVGNAEAMLVRR